MCVCVCVCVCIYAHGCLIYAQVRLYIHKHACVYTHRCGYIPTGVTIYTQVYMHACVHIHTRVRAYTLVVVSKHMCIHAGVCITHKCGCMCTQVCTSTLRAHGCIYAHKHTLVLCTVVRIYTRVCMHIRRDLNIHTGVCLYTAL